MRYHDEVIWLKFKEPNNKLASPDKPDQGTCYICILLEGYDQVGNLYAQTIGYSSLYEAITF